jgi:hypothetical protein
MYYLFLYLIWNPTSLNCPLPPPNLFHLSRFHTLRLAPHPTARVPLSFTFTYASLAITKGAPPQHRSSLSTGINAEHYHTIGLYAGANRYKP